MNERWQRQQNWRAEPVYGYAYEYVCGGTTERPPNMSVEPEELERKEIDLCPHR